MFKLYEVVKPTKFELVIYLTISLIVLSISQFTNILNKISADTAVEDSEMIFTTFFDQLNSFTTTLNDSELAAPFVIALFWSFIGVVVYLGVALFRKFWLDAENDLIVEAQYVHPKNYTHTGFWALFLGRVVFRVTILVLMFIYIIFAFQVLIPIWITEVDIWIGDPSNAQAMFNALLAIPGMMLTFHIFVILVRLLFLRERVF